MRKHQDENKPYTFPLFSPFETQFKCVAFSVFAASEILSIPFKSKKKEEKIIKKKSWCEMGHKRKDEPLLMAYIPPNLTPLMFPDME